METLAEAKKFLNDNWEKGTTCPCCKQNVKMYKVKLTGGMANVLIKFYKARLQHLQGWIHPITEFKTVNGDYAKLRHWGLLEKKEGNNDSSVKASGFWRITNTGIDFVRGDVYLPQKVKLFNNKSYGFDGDRVSIRQALGSKFNFEELMNE